MKVQKIKIQNILGIEALEIQPGSITEITGANGSGKTSCLDAIRAALGAGHDATLLRQGEEKGRVVLLLDDGTEIERSITPDTTNISVKHPDYGKISKPAAYIKKLADALSLNPVAFLTAGKKDRVNQLLQAIPMQVTAEQLKFVPTIALSDIDLDKHALEVLGTVGKSIFDFRTGVNRAEKEKRSTVNQLTETLPEDAPEGDWNETFDNLNSELRDLQTSTGERLQVIDRETKDAKRAAAKQAEAHINNVKKELEEAIEKLRADANIEIERTREECTEAFEKAEAQFKEQRNAEELAYRPKESELKEKIGQAKAMIEQHTKAESTRNFIKQTTAEADKLEAESTKLTHALGQLEILKSELLESLPIQGVSIQDGDIYVDGIVFDRVNESRRIRLAIEIAKLRAGELGLVAVDGLERLDPESYKIFKAEAAKTDLQFVVAKVTDGPLTIDSSKEVA